MGHAHGAVDKGLELHVRTAQPDFCQLCERDLASQHAPPCPLLAPVLHASPAHHVGLRRHVQLQFRRDLPRQLEDRWVGNDEPVGLEIAEYRKALFDTLEVSMVREEIECEVDLLPSLMGETDSRGQAVERESRPGSQR